MEMHSVSDQVEPSYPRRPVRLPVLYSGLDPFYFVTFSTRQRIPVLAQQEVHRTFIEFCERAKDLHVLVGGYVLMPDHIHLLVVMPERSGQSLNVWIKAMKSILGKTLLALGIEKPHWQEGFFDHVLRSKESHRTKRDYILQNPVRAGLCQRVEDWMYRGEIVAL